MNALEDQGEKAVLATEIPTAGTVAGSTAHDHAHVEDGPAKV